MTRVPFKRFSWTILPLGLLFLTLGVIVAACAQQAGVSYKTLPPAPPPPPNATPAGTALAPAEVGQPELLGDIPALSGGLLPFSRDKDAEVKEDTQAYGESNDLFRARPQDTSKIRQGTVNEESLSRSGARTPPPAPASGASKRPAPPPAAKPAGGLQIDRESVDNLAVKGTRGLADQDVLKQEWEKRKLGALSAQAQASRSLRAAVNFPGSLPPLSDEVWVIQRWRDPQADARRPADDAPASGSLLARMPDDQGAIKQVPVPLKHTSVKAAIAGNIASVDVTQQFNNPFASKIEAVYVFPLPENAAVSDFVMTVGDRRIRGIIRDREEARQIYNAAKSQGYTASLLEQERPNIFTQSVANIEPGKNIDIAITYFNTLQYIDGEFEFVFPMVVGPRYNPPATYDGIGAVSREAAAQGPGSSGQSVEVAYLKPSERSGHDIDITVSVNAGTPIERLYSDSHVVDVAFDNAARTLASARLSPRDNIPNKDLVLRCRLAAETTRSSIVINTDKDGSKYFSLLLIPPAQTQSLKRAPVELVFVLDCSGSMGGRPIEQAVAAVVRALRRLDPDDTFQIINFANTASQLGPAPLPATDANIRRGIEYAQSLFAQGGTEMLNGIRASLAFPHDPKRLRFVCFLTDGYIGNEPEILAEIQARLADSRIFSFGVGTSVNRYLIEAMGKVGRGAVAHVAAGDSPERIVDGFFDRISRPALTDIAVDFGALEVEDVFPRRLPDLFVGRVLTITGKLKPGASFSNTVIRIAGSQAGEKSVIDIPLTVSGIVPPTTHPALAKIWARAKLADLADTGSPSSIQESLALIKQVALTHNLMSAFTSFVAVDTLAPTQGAYGTTVTVPVPMPEGVQYESNVGSR